ncbi:alpha-L-fucosidase [Sphingobacterium spiritivorum]|uniref:alpha-L-fucosidase n=1 Tax=Sphingobacterium spiritivorum TaxID=258 RepID=UPI003DA64BDF
MKKIRLILILINITVSWPGSAQEFIQAKSETYVTPTDPAVIKKLEHWRDLKFGMFIHYGLYTQAGATGLSNQGSSWSLTNMPFVQRDTTIEYSDFKQKYFSQINSFNPQKLNPEKLARLGKKAGMKYLIFTSKHHDGFNLFDTRQTNFSIMHGAYKNNHNANILKYFFEAFRKQGYMVGAYYSKPDWHSPYYWWDKYPTSNGGENYNTREYPERWDKFIQFTNNQVAELTNGDYGNVDILWIDAWGQEWGMNKKAEIARSKQPGILIIERGTPGTGYEDYQTPEQGIPKEQMLHPWESCITLGKRWSYIPTDEQYFKSSAQVIHTLVEIVAKGGSLLLGFSPKADGTIAQSIVDRLEEIGKWTSRNGEAIYNTRNTEIYHQGNTWFTQSKDGKKIYAITNLEEGKAIPSTITWQGNEPAGGSVIKCLQTGKKVVWKKTENGIEITLPKGLPDHLPAVAFVLTKV